MFNDLSYDTLDEILSLLDPKEFNSLSKTCDKINKFVNKPDIRKKYELKLKIRSYTLKQQRERYIYPFPLFDELWNSIPDNENDNSFTDERLKLIFDSEVVPMKEKQRNRSRNKICVVPQNNYVLIGMFSDGIRVININQDAILKHKIGSNPYCWSYEDAKFDHIPKEDGMGPLYVVDDKYLLGSGLFNMINGAFSPFHEFDDIEQEILKQIIRNKYKKELSLGDMVHIPVYDDFSSDHGDIYRYILIYNGKKLVKAIEQSNYGFSPPRECKFPQFTIEHFLPLGRSGGLIEGYRWLSGEILELVNAAQFVYSNENENIKKININGKDYFFYGGGFNPYVDIQNNLVEITNIENTCIEESEIRGLGIKYLLQILEKL